MKTCREQNPLTLASIHELRALVSVLHRRHRVRFEVVIVGPVQSALKRDRTVCTHDAAGGPPNLPPPSSWEKKLGTVGRGAVKSSAWSASRKGSVRWEKDVATDMIVQQRKTKLTVVVVVPVIHGC